MGQSSPLFAESVGINSPESYYQQSYQQTASYNPYEDQPIEEKSSLEKTFEAFLESTRQVQIIANSILPKPYPKSKILTLIFKSNYNKKNLLT